MIKKCILSIFSLVLIGTVVEASTQRSIVDLEEAVSLIKSKVPNVINQAQAAVAWTNTEFPLEEGKKYDNVELWITSILNQEKPGEEVAEDLIHHIFNASHNQGFGYYTVDPAFISDDEDTVDLLKWLNLCVHLTEEDGTITMTFTVGWFQRSSLFYFKFSEDHGNFRINFADMKKFGLFNLFLSLKYNDTILSLDKAVIEFSADINAHADVTFKMNTTLGILLQNAQWLEDGKMKSIKNFRASIGPRVNLRYIAESEEIKIDEDDDISGLSLKVEFEGISDPTVSYNEEPVTDFLCEFLIPFNPVRFFLDRKVTFQFNENDPVRISYARLPAGPILTATMLCFWPIPLEIKEGKEVYGINMWDLISGKYNMSNGFPLDKIEEVINWLQQNDGKYEVLEATE